MVGTGSRDGHTLRLEQQWRTNLGKSDTSRPTLRVSWSPEEAANGVLGEDGTLQLGVQAHARSCYWALHLDAKMWC